MRKLLTMLAALLLCGCTNVQNLEKSTAESIAEASKARIYSANISKPYYSFYKEPCIGRVDADQTSDIMNVDGAALVMNLNVPEIVNANFFTEVPVASARISREPVLKMEGTLKDRENKERAWKLFAYELEDSTCAVIFHTYAATFYTVCPAVQIPDLTGHIVKIARSVTADTEAILDAYTTKETVVFAPDKIHLFESSAPVNGRIEELFVTDNTLGYEENPNGDNGLTQIVTDGIDDGDITK